MTCNGLESRAMEYLDGKLAAAERSVVEAHLAGCAACRLRVQSLSSVMGLLDEWPGIQPSPFFGTRLAARLKEEPASPGWWQTFWQEGIGSPLHPSPRPVFALALAVVMAVGAVVLQYSPAPLGPPQPGGTLASASADELPLYPDLPLLEDYEVLRNFEALQVLSNTQQVVPR